MTNPLKTSTYRHFHLPHWQWIYVFLVFLCFSLPAAADFEVAQARTQLEGDTYVLDARIDYGFSDRALEALDNGVPLTLLVHIQVRPTQSWIWTNSLVDESLRFRIRYKPLSESYLVTELPGAGGTSYVSRDAAIDALGEIHNLHLLNRNRLDPNTEYTVAIRVSLDIEQLPLPLRPTAYLHPAWKQSSNWTRWPLEP